MLRPKRLPVPVKRYDDFWISTKCSCRKVCQRGSCDNDYMNVGCDKDNCNKPEYCDNKKFAAALDESDKKVCEKPSNIDGLGLFTTRALPRGTILLQYAGSVTSNFPCTNNCMVAKLQNGHYVNGAVNGNEARFVNHSCSSTLIWFVAKFGECSEFLFKH